MRGFPSRGPSPAAADPADVAQAADAADALDTVSPTDSAAPDDTVSATDVTTRDAAVDAPSAPTDAGCSGRVGAVDQAQPTGAGWLNATRHQTLGQAFTAGSTGVRTGIELALGGKARASARRRRSARATS